MYETAVVSATEKCSLGAKIRKMSLQAYLLLSIKIAAWPTKTLKPPQPKPTIGYNFVNRAYGHPGGAGYRRG
jgi:hypothetical protein